MVNGFARTAGGAVSRRRRSDSGRVLGAALFLSTTAACAAPGAGPDPRASRSPAPPTSGLNRSMPQMTGPGAPAAPQSADLPTSLRGVAAALAASGATPEAVLQAARVRDVRRGRDEAEFAPADARLGAGYLKLTGIANVGPAPGFVAFELDEQRPPVTLAEVAREFGAWQPGTATESHPWKVVSTDGCRASATRSAEGASIYVRASLSGDPREPGTRVTKLLLRRDRDQP